MLLVADCMNFVEVADVGNDHLQTCSTRKIILEGTADFFSYKSKKK